MMPSPTPIPAAPPSEADRLREALRHTVYCAGRLTCGACADSLRLLGEEVPEVCALCQSAPCAGTLIVCAECAGRMP